MVRNGLVASLVTTGNFTITAAKIVTYESGQTTVTIKEDLGRVVY